MFSKKKETIPQKRIDSLIGSGTTIDGDLSFTGGLRIDGQVKGNVWATSDQPATLVLSEHARVDGEIRVSHLVVNGTVNGPIVANDYLELQANAKVHGDVQYKTLEMHFGAIVQGQLKLVSGTQESASVVELKRSIGGTN